METSLWGNWIVGTLRPDVSVARCASPNLEGELGEGEEIEDCELFHELQGAVLASLGQGETLILNLGLVESAPPGLVRYLLKVCDLAWAFGARLVLCRLGPTLQQLLKDTQTLPRFALARGEEDAVRGLAEAWGGARDAPRLVWP